MTTEEKRTVRREWINFYLQKRKYTLAQIILWVRLAESIMEG